MQGAASGEISTGESGNSGDLDVGCSAFSGKVGLAGPWLLAWSWAETGAGSSSSFPKEALGWKVNSRGQKALPADYPCGLWGEGKVRGPQAQSVLPLPYQSLKPFL